MTTVEKLGVLLQEVLLDEKGEGGEGEKINATASETTQPALAIRDIQGPQLLKVIEVIRSAIATGQIENCSKAVLATRKFLSLELKPPISEVIAAGGVPLLVQLLAHDHHAAIQYDAAWALTNIASGDRQHTQAVLDAGAVPEFIRLMDSPNVDLGVQVMWALGNIAGDSPEMRDHVLGLGVMDRLLEKINDINEITSLSRATWVLANLCRGKPPPDFEVTRKSIPIVSKLVYADNDELLKQACWCLSHLSHGPNEQIDVIIESGCVRRVAQLLNHPNDLVKEPALRTIGNIATGDDGQTQLLLNLGVIPTFLQLLNSPKKAFRKETCWTISNITAGSSEQIQAIIDAHILPRLLQIMKTESYDTKKEAAWALSNATSGATQAQLKYMISIGLLQHFCALLLDAISYADTNLTKLVNDGILNGNVTQFTTEMESAGVMDSLWILKGHPNNDISQVVQNILSHFEPS